MKIIECKIEEIKDELCGAQKYAERYVRYKKSKPEWAQRFADMAAQEIAHADNLKSMGQQFVEELSYVPESDREKWECCMDKATEQKAYVQLILTKG